eukprot:CFRG8664
MKYKASLKLVCNFCQFVRRKGKLRIVCSDNPKHKKCQG